MPLIGQRNWVLITKDKNIRRNQLEVDAILNANLRAFVITAVNVGHHQLADLLIKVMRKVLRICRQQGPFVFNITAGGTISQIPKRVLRRRGRSTG